MSLGGVYICPVSAIFIGYAGRDVEGEAWFGDRSCYGTCGSRVRKPRLHYEGCRLSLCENKIFIHLCSFPLVQGI